MDNFKKYIQQHRDELDTDNPPEGLLDNILAGVHEPEKKKRIIPFAVYRIAAACVLALAVISTVYYFMAEKKPHTPDMAIIKTTHLPSSVIEKSGNNIQSLTAMKVDTSKAVQTEKTGNRSLNTEPVTARNNKSEKHKKEKVMEQPSENDRLISKTMAIFTGLVDLEKQQVNRTPLYAESPVYYASFKQQLHQLDSEEKTLRHHIGRHGLDDATLDQLIEIYNQKIYILKQLRNEISKTNSRFLQSEKGQNTKVSYLNL